MISDTQKKILLEEFPELGGSDVVLQKEMYAHFGLLFFKFSLVEHSLIIVLLYQHLGKKFNAGKIRSRNEWEKQWDKANLALCKLPMGQLVGRAVKILEFKDIEELLSQVLKRRNYMAHYYFREEAPIYSLDEGIWHILWEFYELGKLVISLEDAIKPRFEAMCERLSFPVPDDMQKAEVAGQMKEEAISAVVSGNPKFGWHEISEDKQ